MENVRGFPWLQRSSFEVISAVTTCGGWRDPAGTPSRSGVCSLWHVNGLWILPNFGRAKLPISRVW
jgi:hypothetical protein